MKPKNKLYNIPNVNIIPDDIVTLINSTIRTELTKAENEFKAEIKSLTESFSEQVNKLKLDIEILKEGENL